MSIVPRSYQIDCVDSIWNYFVDKVGNPIAAMPTGTGKSIVIAMLLQRIFANYPNTKVMQLTHVKELIQQNFAKLLALWPGAPAGINSAGLNKRDFHDKIIFAGIGSVARYASAFGHVDLLLIDEAHLVSPAEDTQYRMFIQGLKSINPNLKVIGFTATKWRSGSGLLTKGGLFTDVCFDITDMESFNRLIAEGYLARLVPKKTRTLLSVDGVHMRGGEFIQSELQDAVDRDEVTQAALEEAVVLGHDRKHWLAFASGVEHAVHISEMLNAMGIPSAAVHSKMSGTERDRIIVDYRAGRLRCVANNNVLTTGFDFPGIDFIIMMRPTAASVLWVQMLGRGTRPSAETEKTDCLVADYAGNTKRLGPINDPVIPGQKGKKTGDAPVKLCEKCDCYNHTSVRICAYCGEPFPLVVKIKQEASSEDLIAGAMPITEVFKIERITVALHQKQGRPDAMRVTYYPNDYTKFDKYVGVEYGPSSGLARRWWREHSDLPCPNKTLEILMAFEHLKRPTDIRVWTNKPGKYPSEILAYCFDGTGFGTREASDSDEGPRVENKMKKSVYTPIAAEVQAGKAQSTHASNEFDDDIPF